MIKKLNEINENLIKSKNLFLFYGVNEGSKNEKIKELIGDSNKTSILNYEESQILDDEVTFLEQIQNKSLFEEKKNIIIKRASNKILNIIESIVTKNISDLIIVNAGNLDKKSKLRNYFEKEKNLICVAFYQDTQQILSDLTYNFIKKNNISLSQANINLIINKCNGDRAILLNELDKIRSYSLNNKKINSEDLLKLINLIENYSISELVDNCLAKNINKTIGILNENNYENSDCIIIIRTFLSKAKKIFNLCKTYEKNRNLELTINSYKPPIFWKEKEITKQQIIKWNQENIKNLIFKINEIELQIKKDISKSVHIITDFILEQTRQTN